MRASDALSSALAFHSTAFENRPCSRRQVHLDVRCGFEGVSDRIRLATSSVASRSSWALLWVFGLVCARSDVPSRRRVVQVELHRSLSRHRRQVGECIIWLGSALFLQHTRRAVAVRSRHAKIAKVTPHSSPFSLVSSPLRVVGRMGRLSFIPQPLRDSSHSPCSVVAVALPASTGWL